MKNLSNENNQNTYIINYIIKDMEIIIQLADNSEYRIPYTEENEKKVLAKMEEQILSAYVKDVSISTKILAISQPMLLPMSIFNYVSSKDTFHLVLMLIHGAGIIYFPSIWINKLLKESYINKAKFFISNKAKINYALQKNTSNMLIGINNKKIKRTILSNLGSNKDAITINDIDLYTMKTLRQLISNLERIEEFDFIETEELIEQNNPFNICINEKKDNKEKLLRL